MASTSRTICPLATPPMAGLQLICAMVPIFMVTNKTDEPKLAAAAAASHPAWPAPTTITLYFLNIFTSMFHVEHICFYLFFDVPRGTLKKETSANAAQIPSKTTNG